MQSILELINPFLNLHIFKFKVEFNLTPDHWISLRTTGLTEAILCGGGPDMLKLKKLKPVHANLAQRFPRELEKTKISSR